MKQWKLFSDKNGIETYIYEGSLNGSGVMASGVFDFTPQQIMDFLKNPDAFSKANPVIEMMDTFEEINPDNVFFHMKIKRMMVVAARDFVGISKKFIDKDGHANILIYSTEHQDKPEQADGTIRGEIIVGGWHFEIIEPTKTKATNFVVNDYKGNIPKFALNMAAPTQATVFANLKKGMAELQAEGKL